MNEQELPPLQCSLYFGAYSSPERTCQSPLTIDLWNLDSVDESLSTFVKSGIDHGGNWWPGIDGTAEEPVMNGGTPSGPTTSLSQSLGSKLLNYGSFICSLESHCTIPLFCDQIGPQESNGKPIEPLYWGFAVLSAIEHISQQLSNQYVAMKGAAISGTLATFNIEDFYPEPNKEFDILDTLTGLGTVLGAAAGFSPNVGPGLGAGGAVLPAIGSFIGRSLEKEEVMVAQKTFAPKVQQLYMQFVEAIDDLGTALINGSNVTGVDGFNLQSVLSNGSWVDQSVLTPVSDLEHELSVEILSRSIDALWGTAPSNKRWVLFVDLEDGDSTTKCMAHWQGPSDSKYCADGGVYYTYNFIEGTSETGYVGYPWGAQKLRELNSDLNLSVSLFGFENCLLLRRSLSG